MEETKPARTPIVRIENLDSMTIDELSQCLDESERAIVVMNQQIITSEARGEDFGDDTKNTWLIRVKDARRHKIQLVEAIHEKIESFQLKVDSKIAVKFVDAARDILSEELFSEILAEVKR